MISLSKTECLEIIQKAYNKKFKLLSYRFDVISEKSIGFLGDYATLITDIKDENNKCITLTFFIKSVPINKDIEEDRKEEYNRIFKKECALYKFFEKFPTTTDNENDKWRPICYYMRSDIIVLDHLHNFGYFHEKEQFTFNHMKAVLNNLAKLHAFSIAFEVENSIKIGDQYKDMLYETSIEKDIQWFNVGIEAIKTVITHYPKFQSNKCKKFIKDDFYKSIEPIYDMAKSSTEFRNVLCHRDSWGNNIFFNYLNNNDENNNTSNLTSVLVDFQTCCYCPPAVDVLFLIYLNTRRSYREKIFDQCIKCYHTELDNQLKLLNIKSVIKFDEFVKSCNKLKLLSIVYNCIASTIVKLPGDYLKNLKKDDPKNYEDYMIKSRNDVLEKLLSEDQHFNEVMLESVEELMELICY